MDNMIQNKNNIMKHANRTYEKRIDARRQLASVGRVSLKAASNVIPA